MLRRNLLLALSLVAAPLMAQEARNTIDPGMTRDEVVQRLGKPLNERTSGTHTYMFYRNGCEKSCGMNDLVVLEDGKVVDAVFRNGVRAYSGASSSPSGVQTTNSAAGDASAVAKVRKARRGGIVIARPAPGEDAKPGSAIVTGLQVEPTPGPAQPAPTSPLLGARMNPADSVRALTPGRPTPIPGTKLNSTDSARAEAIKRQQQADSTRKP
ncbi:MAG: hypothetical protein HOQ11_11100 [Gemmatimonadaceae bacterium]|nr:hypothetical protein [Gemmatimonadaceae bacterium]NUQ92058.1 hypothetical protein [Gemmatimonadaceae bacterium]NUR19508.1 hypothetical protein [Gemmatimonadaceae bacterium]NUS97941.1 hypothetical protein [Gemmatimonadaceae bacterium]